MLAVTAEIPLDPDERERALELMTDLEAKSQAEEGMIDYRVAIDVADPNTLIFLEQYEDEQAFEDHMQADHTQEFVAALPDLVAGEVEGYRLEVESRSELEM